tara:strand:+ start:323 stop:673 length:351 start_codon:yes stop_codon:yes gene_type:complete
VVVGQEIQAVVVQVLLALLQLHLGKLLLEAGVEFQTVDLLVMVMVLMVVGVHMIQRVVLEHLQLPLAMQLYTGIMMAVLDKPAITILLVVVQERVAMEDHQQTITLQEEVAVQVYE